MGAPPYEILDVPAAGAFAALVVVRAASGDRVALKVLKAELAANGDAVSRFRDEARLLNRIRHPHVVRADGLYSREGRPVLALEWIDGMPGDALLRASPQGLPHAVAGGIVAAVASALDAAWHAPGDDGRTLQAVHRDIKPENVLFAVNGDVKLVDFGAASGRIAAREARVGEPSRGTKGFESPERADGAPDHPSIDTYALGLTLFLLLTGKPAVISAKVDKHDPAMRALLDHIPRGDLTAPQHEQVRHLIRRMCLFEADLRPSPKDVARTLQQLFPNAAQDLASYAEAHVRPIVAARAARDPRQHPLFADLRFLGADDGWETLEDPNTPPESCDAQVRAFLAAKDWERRVSELQLVLARYGRWTAEPLLEHLQRAAEPRWKVWAPRPTPAQTELLLQFLAQRADARVKALAAAFEDDRDEGVREAARRLRDGG